VTGGFASRFRWGLLIGLLLTLGIIVKDVWLGTFDGLASPKMMTLLLTMVIAALLWAWIAGRFGRNDDA
jgi:hypothetical protein